MKNKKKFIVVVVCAMVMGLTACASGKDNTTDDFQQAEPFAVETENEEQQSLSEEQQSSFEEQQAVHEQETLDNEDEELDEKLAAYREKRENTKPVSLGNGVTMGGTVDPEEFDIVFDASPLQKFDTRELMAAIDTANSYVEKTLEVSVETQHITEMCVDPRIWEIYAADDKGVANGYEPENIFLREYCDNGIWQYLILVRDGKDRAWEVIHHGSSYMEGK